MEKWCTRQDSNLWPLPSEGSALSSWATSAIRIPRVPASLDRRLWQMMSHLSMFDCLVVTRVWPIKFTIGTAGTWEIIYVLPAGQGPPGRAGAIASKRGRVLLNFKLPLSVISLQNKCYWPMYIVCRWKKILNPLEKHRRNKRKTQAEVAEFLGITQSQYSKVGKCWVFTRALFGKIGGSLSLWRGRTLYR